MKSFYRVVLSLFLVLLMSFLALGLWSVLWPEQVHAVVYAVTLTSDTPLAPLPGVPGELRWAINMANSTIGVPDNITFAIPGAGPQTIIPLAPLPAVIDTVTIDGYTQPGSVPPGAGPASILIEIAGLGAGPADGLWFQLNGANGSVVRGLTINRFSQNGIFIQSANNIIVEGNNIGTDVVGGTPLPNAQNGVYVFGGATGCTIGGPAAPSRNVISGNGLDGIRMVGSTGNTVSANYIGLDGGGAVKVANSRDGVYLSTNSNNNTIGGLAVGQRNIISGNAFEGINIDNSTGNNVQGNYIGTDVNGSLPLSNGTAGVYLVSGGANNTIGGNTSSHRNVISGNASYGVFFNGSSGSFVYGNFIGTDATGVAAMANGIDGVFVFSGSNANAIGGGAAGQGNVISGNTQRGVYIVGSTGNMVEGNYVGLNAAGNAALGNWHGIYLSGGANNNTIGGTTAGQRNVVSGNGFFGIVVDSSSGNTVSGNHVGTDPAGNLAMGNAVYGVFLDNGSTNNTVGGTTAGHRNVISGNSQYGVAINNSTGNFLQGNYVGVNSAGTAGISNWATGVYIYGGSNNNTIGGNTAGHRNVISSNSGAGLWLDNVTGCTVSANYIGPDAAGGTALGNGTAVYITNGGNHTVGGTTAAEGNLLSGNGYQGVYITASSGNQVKANYVGVNAAGTGALGNAQDGIYLNGANSNTIGGTTAAERNVVSANAGNGVRINGSFSNTVSGNYVGTDAAGSNPLANALSGVLIEGSASANAVGGSTFSYSNVISGNGQSGIRINGSAGNKVQANYIGTDMMGTAALSNGMHGVFLENSADNNSIGGSVAGEGNVISGNTAMGVRINGSAGNAIEGNQIGTDVTGATPLRNNGDGVYLGAAASGNTVGGATAGHRNLISGNYWSGVRINNATGNFVYGNYIGTDLNGTSALPNRVYGVWIESGANTNAIGGATAGQGNLISGNTTATGVYIDASTGNALKGNYIGTNAAGTAALANGGDGVHMLNGANNSSVGGSTAAERNLVSGNGGRGITIDGSTGNTMSGNYIGTNAAGTAALANGGEGVCLINSANGNTVGGGTPGQGNIISGNGEGILVDGSTGNTFAGNYVGPNAAGNAGLGNSNYGIHLANGADNNTVGGPSLSQGNLVSANGFDGIYINGSSGNNLQGNYIGTNAAGTAAMLNANHGVSLMNSTNNTIGGVDYTYRNLISGNGGNGVYVRASSNNTVYANYIGTDVAGTAAIANAGSGIGVVEGSTGNTIGGTTTPLTNVISGNAFQGIYFDASTGNTVSGNYVGIDVTGVAALGNGTNGVSFSTAANDNTVGGTTFNERNIISGNTGHGISVNQSTGNDILGNSIGSDAPMTGSIPNSQDGVHIEASSDNTLVGVSAATSNYIAHNGRDGVRVQSSVDCEVGHNQVLNNTGIGVNVLDSLAFRNEISENSIYGNGGLGIDLMGDGVTPNDGNNNNPAKADRGYNFPVFVGTPLVVGGSTYVSGTAPPNAEVELYYTGATPDPSGHGEGQAYKGSTTANPSGSFSATLTGLSVGDSISAIAISPSGDPSGEGNTSEFSANAQVAQGYNVSASVSGGYGSVGEPSQDVVSGGTATIHIFPDAGCHITSITDNGVPATIVSPYVISNVTATHTVVVTFAPDVYPWYMAEGCTEGGMETWVLVQNPNAFDVTVDLVFMASSGVVNGPQDIPITAGTRTSFNVGAYVTDWNVSTRVDAAGGNVICERAMYGPGRAWAHDSIGTTETAVKWYLAEGSTDGGMETWVLVQNPGATEVGVYISFQTDTGEVTPPALQDVSIPATSRRSFRVNDYVTSYNVSTRVDSPDGGVICERSVYGPGRSWAHESIGVIVPETTWYLAEGSTDGGMETFVLVQNPTDYEAHVNVVFQTDTGEVAPVALQGVPVPANSRRTFKANDYVTSFNVSTRVTSLDQRIICERAMYGNNRDWAHDSIGVTTPAATWYLAEGCTGGDFETFLLVQNPNTVDVTVDLTFMTSTGEQAGPQDFKIRAGSRHTFKLNDCVTDWNVSTKVESTGGDVICERAMYGNGRSWAHDSIGYSP